MSSTPRQCKEWLITFLVMKKLKTKNCVTVEELGNQKQTPFTGTFQSIFRSSRTANFFLITKESKFELGTSINTVKELWLNHLISTFYSYYLDSKQIKINFLVTSIYMHTSLVHLALTYINFSPYFESFIWNLNCFIDK